MLLVFITHYGTLNLELMNFELFTPTDPIVTP
jgi:hypothetical protein